MIAAFARIASNSQLLQEKRRAKKGGLPPFALSFSA